MAELFTAEELTAQLREDVAKAGGAKKWLRKNKILFGNEHILHMVTDGRAATLDEFLRVLGFRRVVRYEPIQPNNQ